MLTDSFFKNKKMLKLLNIFDKNISIFDKHQKGAIICLFDNVKPNKLLIHQKTVHLNSQP